MLPTLASAAALCVGLASLSRAAVYPTRFEATTWDDSNWRITTNLVKRGYEARMGLANGYLGINLAATGPFFDIDNQSDPQSAVNRWPLYDRRQSFATISGFFGPQEKLNGTNYPWLDQYGWNEAISGLPHWSGLHIRSGKSVLGANVSDDEISGFSSTLDMGAGTMSWSYTWSPPDGPAIHVDYSMLVHKLLINQAVVQLKITPLRNANITVLDVLNGDAAVRTAFKEKSYVENEPTIWTAVSPEFLPNVTAYIYSTLRSDDASTLSQRSRFDMPAIIGANSSSIAQAVDLNLTAGRTTVITKYVGAASTDAFDDPKTTAQQAAANASATGYEALLASHITEWQSILTPESVDDYRNPETGKIPDDENIRELQITAISNPFQLLQNTVGENAVVAAGNNSRLGLHSISVCGLYGSCYAGFIFWDSDVWMAPGLVVAHPQAAKQIEQYRVERFPQAKQNILEAYQGSQNQTGKFSPEGAIYGWTEGRFANSTATGPSWDYQYHLNSDIGLGMYHYLAVTGDSVYFNESLLPVYDAIAQMFVDLVDYNATTGQYEIRNATSPDEFSNNKNNSGFTMISAKTHIDTANRLRQRYGLQPNATWANISALLTIPTNEEANIILEFQGMNNSISVKQADVVLVDDFLDYPNPYSLSNLDYYASKQSLSGPAMTYGVFSIVANRFSPSGCSSYTYDLYGSQPYTRAPWFQFSEQLVEEYNLAEQTNFAYPFLTGVGGAHRVAVFGYLGLRLDLDALSIDPSLPPQLEHLSYRNIYWQGHEISASSNQSHTSLRRTGRQLASANMTFAASPIPVRIGLSQNSTTLQLSGNSTLVVENRHVGDVKTVAGNLAQCRPVTSESKYETGQFPLAAVDGAVSTKWQPTLSNISSSFTVSLAEPFAPIHAIHFDWAQSPPKSFQVSVSNSSTGADAVLVTSSDNVTISNPYDAGTADVIAPYSSNTTNVTLPTPVWSGRYATLSILGNHANDGTPNERNGTGASVAEFALIAVGGATLTGA